MMFWFGLRVGRKQTEHCPVACLSLEVTAFLLMYPDTRCGLRAGLAVQHARPASQGGLLSGYGSFNIPVASQAQMVRQGLPPGTHIPRTSSMDQMQQVSNTLSIEVVICLSFFWDMDGMHVSTWSDPH